MTTNIRDLRKDYTRQRLEEADALASPIDMFRIWLDEALNTPAIIEPNAMTLATVSAAGKPSARVVLLRGYDARGFCFYTNYESRKGQEIAQTGAAALVFWWGALERQIRIEGDVEKVTAEESDTYYNSRPWGSRLGAWVSEQSTVLDGRGVLEDRLAEYTAKYEGIDPPRPPHWGGYRLVPTMIEFWQGGLHRLHDRLRYAQEEDGKWRIERLSP